MRRFPNLILAWITASILGVCSLAASEDQGVKNVAIIGAGAAGSSAAYHLKRYYEEENDRSGNGDPVSVNITIFEKTPRIGGRTLTVDVYSDPSEPVELGASIFVKVNRILYDATDRFDLALRSLCEGSPGDVTAIWNGDEFVYRTTDGEGWWWDAGRMFWRYGTSPYYALQLVKKVVDQFTKLYDEPWFPFRSLTQRVFELDLAKATGMTGEQYLAENKINPDFSRDIIQAATRVNYASNLAYIHGVEAMVSFATEGAVAVAGGNWQIFDKMVQHSGAALYRNTTVTSITKSSSQSDDASPRYKISTANSATTGPLTTTGEAKDDEEYPIAFDKVVIASPWQFSDIQADGSVLGHKIESIPYMKLHVTLFTSPYKLRPGFFGLEPGDKAPSNVYTTLGKDEEPHEGGDGVGRTGFYSISTLRTVTNPRTGRREYLYKIFSPDVVSATFLSDILGVEVPGDFVVADDAGNEDDGDSGAETAGAISWYHPTWFHSYPVELPRVTFQDPIVGDGVYYTSGMESFISTMETSALMGMNVARLIADDFAGVERVASPMEAEEVRSKKKTAEDEL